MHSIFSVKSDFLGDFLGSVKICCGRVRTGSGKFTGTPYTPYAKRIKRFKNYFNTNSKFPWVRIYLGRGLMSNSAVFNFAGKSQIRRFIYYTGKLDMS